MIYISPAENGFHAECSSCRRELHISEDKIAETKDGVILLREAELCRCGQKSARVDTLTVPHNRILTKLDELVTLLSRRELAEQEGAGIRERLEAKAPPFPILMLLKKDGLSALRFLGIAAGVAAAFEVLLLAIGGIVYLIGTMLGQSTLTPMGNGIIGVPNSLFAQMGFDAVLGKGERSFADVLAGMDYSTSFDVTYIGYALLGAALCVIYVSLIFLAVRLVITGVRFVLYKRQAVEYTRQCEQYRPEGEARLRQLEKNILELEDEISLSDILPSAYGNLDAANSIYSYFAANRVDTMRQAINLYHAEKSEQLTRQLLSEILGELKKDVHYNKSLYRFSINPYEHQVEQVYED